MAEFIKPQRPAISKAQIDDFIFSLFASHERGACSCAFGYGLIDRLLLVLI